MTDWRTGPLPERLRKRAVKLRTGTNDQHTPDLLDEAAKAIEEISTDYETLRFDGLNEH